MIKLAQQNAGNVFHTEDFKKDNFCKKIDGEYFCSLTTYFSRCSYFESMNCGGECGGNPEGLHCISARAHRDTDSLSKLEAI